MANLEDYIEYLAKENYIWYSTTRRSAVIFKNGAPEVTPAEPITKPVPTTVPRPEEDDPFNVPAPLVNPTPKGFTLG